MKKIIIIGTGALASQFHHFIKFYSENNVIGWLDDFRKEGDFFEDLPVLGRVDSLFTNPLEFDEVIVAIGYKHLSFKRETIALIKEKKIKLHTFIHPSSYIDCTSTIAEGCFIYPNVTIDKNVVLKSGNILNNSVTISHNSNIGECNFLAPSVTFSGNVNVGNCNFIGTGSIVSNNVSINNSIILGIGSIIISDILEPGTYVGGPKLKFIKNENNIQ